MDAKGLTFRKNISAARYLKHLLLLGFLVVMPGIMMAQQPVVLLGGAGYALSPREFPVLNVPAQLPDVEAYNTTWEIMLQGGLNSFQLEHRNYGKVTAAYSLFSLGNYSPFGEAYPEDLIKRVAYKIFESSVLQEIVYAWVRPYYTDAFDEMIYDDQIQYMEMFREAERYLATFDYEKEKGDLRADAEGFARKKGKLNAFLFRRIHTKQMSLEDCRSWIKRLLNDFGSHLKDPNDPLSQCESMIPIAGNNFLCRTEKLNQWGRRSTSYRLLNKDLKAYDLPSFDDVYTFGNDAWLVPVINGMQALLSLNGDLLTGFKYARIFGFDNYGLALVVGPVEVKDLYIFEEDTWVATLDPPYEDYLYRKGDTLLTSYMVQRCGFIDTSGREVVPLEYTVGLDTVRMTSSFPPYDGYDEVMTSAECIDFLFGVEILKKDEQYGVVDLQGQIVIPFQYADIKLISYSGERDTGLLIVNQGGQEAWNSEAYTMEIRGGLWAVYDLQGRNLSGFVYDALFLNEGDVRLFFRRGSHSGCINGQGREKQSGN